MSVIVRLEDTPNPNARRYVLNRPVQEQAKGRFFRSAGETDEQLAKALFAIEGVDGVMFLPNSVTVNKTNDASWDSVETAARDAIEGYFA